MQERAGAEISSTDVSVKISSNEVLKGCTEPNHLLNVRLSHVGGDKTSVFDD